LEQATAVVGKLTNLGERSFYLRHVLRFDISSNANGRNTMTDDEKHAQEVTELFTKFTDLAHGHEIDVLVPALTNLLAQTLYMSGEGEMKGIAYVADVISYTFEGMGYGQSKQ
jgi:hypothetical protein